MLLNLLILKIVLAVVITVLGVALIFYMRKLIVTLNEKSELIKEDSQKIKQYLSETRCTLYETNDKLKDSICKTQRKLLEYAISFASLLLFWKFKTKKK